MKKIFIITAVLFATQLSYSQSDFRKGYIIKLNHDTVFGSMSYSEGDHNHRSCKFKDAGSENKVTYTPEDLTGYGFVGDKYYEARKVEKDDQSAELVFLELITKGLASLYKFENVFYLEKGESGLNKMSNRTVVTTVDGKEMATESNRYLGVLNMLLSDCAEIKTKIPNTRFNEISLTNLVVKYNSCMNSQSVVYKENKPWLHPRIGISGGLISSAIGWETKQGYMDHMGPFSRVNSPIFGGSFDLSSPRVNERLSFHLDVLFNKSNYKSYNENTLFSTTTKNWVTIDMSLLKIPLGLRYTFPGKNLTTFLEFGLSETISLSSGSEWTKEVTLYYLVDTYHDKALDLRKRQLGIWGGAGLSANLGKKVNCFIEFRYERAEGINSDEFVNVTKSNVTSLQFVIGFATR